MSETEPQQQENLTELIYTEKRYGKLEVHPECPDKPARVIDISLREYSGPSKGDGYMQQVIGHVWRDTPFSRWRCALADRQKPASVFWMVGISRSYVRAAEALEKAYLSGEPRERIEIDGEVVDGGHKVIDLGENPAKSGLRLAGALELPSLITDKNRASMRMGEIK